MLAACGGSQPPLGVPAGSHSYGASVPSFAQRSSVTRGLYAVAFEQPSVFGYHSNNRRDKPPICTVPAQYTNDIAVDARGDLIVPEELSDSIVVYKGPQMCGPELGSVFDPYGQPGDAASTNAATGPIVVANFVGSASPSSPGSLSICSLSVGCTANLTNPQMIRVAGVALALNGDCWASAEDSAGKARLIYFKRCSGGGRVARGFQNGGYGGLDIDNAGHLVSISFYNELYVYKGCDPRCILVSGPFPMQGAVLYGHLNEKNTEFAAGNVSRPSVDVYKYTSKGLTFEYSFNKGFGPSDDIEGAAYNPRSKQ